MRPARAVSAVCASVLAAATLVAQAPASPQTAPTFRGGVQLIDVDVIVTDGDGRPVRGLTPDDFEIVEGDRPQQIRTFSLVDLPFDPPAVLAERRVREVPRDVVSNTTPEGRTYVLLIDDSPEFTENAARMLRARHFAERWLDEVVQPNDRVAVVHTNSSFNHAQGLTSDRRLILKSIERTMMAGSGGATSEDPVHRLLNKFRVVKDIAERLGTIQGRRKAIIWFAEGVDLHPSARMTPTRDGPSNLNDPVASAASHILAAWREAAEAAVNNNVAVYPVDPDGLTTELGLRAVVTQASLREVAEETGGVVLVNTNDFSRGFATIVQDASTYYLLGYTPDPEWNDGKFHPIHVRVKRPDVKVRARRGYYAPALDIPETEPSPRLPQGVSLAARDALRRTVSVPGLGVDVTTAAFKGTGRDASVVITAYVRGQTLDFGAGRRLAVSYQLFDVEGRVAKGFYKVFGFNLGSASRERASGIGLQFTERVTLKPGRYELRLVAEQPGGPIGSVVAHIEVASYDEELDLSQVTLASRPANEVALITDRIRPPAGRSARPMDCMRTRRSTRRRRAERPRAPARRVSRRP